MRSKQVQCFWTFVLLTQCALVKTNEDKNATLYEVKGDLDLALIINNCQNNTPYLRQALINSAIWSVQRVNFLEILDPLQLGLHISEACSDDEHFKILFDRFEDNRNKYFLGAISDVKMTKMVQKFADVLNVRTKTKATFLQPLVKSSVQVINQLGWTENVTFIAPENYLVEEFFHYSRKEMICVKNCIVYQSNCSISFENSGEPFVIFGTKQDLTGFISDLDSDEDVFGVFVPTDGSIITDLPENSFTIIPNHFPIAKNFEPAVNLLPSPLLFEIAEPILEMVESVDYFVQHLCNQTNDKVACVKRKYNNKRAYYKQRMLNPELMVEILKIEPLKNNFVYDVYQVNSLDNNSTSKGKNNVHLPFTKVFTYNIFHDFLTEVNSYQVIDSSNITAVVKLCNEPKETCSLVCKNFYSLSGISIMRFFYGFRSDSWVLVFLAISVLGLLFCVSILIFFFVCMCKKDCILEGNPTLTVLLLLSVFGMYLSVLPFAVKEYSDIKVTLCLIKSIAPTLCFAAAFSLILARCILLATVSKEVAFMSHVSGSVQSFLTLFIFGVQVALTLHLIGRCNDIFKNYSVLYLFSYNYMLLLVTLCLCPLVYRSQRNYREGKHFSIMIGVVAAFWAGWIPIYVVFNGWWNEAMVCLSLVAVASIILGGVFIPRTYMMTISATRTKITCSLPSLGLSNMDVYKTGTQPIYDCVNVAAINAINVARASTLPEDEQLGAAGRNIYNCPTLTQDDEYDFDLQSARNSPKRNNDKLTRF